MLQHLGFAAADHDRRQRLADLVERRIDDAPAFVLSVKLKQAIVYLERDPKLVRSITSSLYRQLTLSRGSHQLARSP